MVAALTSSHDPPSSSVAELIRRAARDAPQGLAFRFLRDDEGRTYSISFGELVELAAAAAYRLERAGASGQRVLLALPPSPEYVAYLLGCLFSGAVVVPAYPPRFGRPLSALTKIIEDSGAAIAIGSRAVVKQVQLHHEECATLANPLWLAGEITELHDRPFQPSHAVDLQAPAVIQYTSGSTSDPKGVVISHGALTRHCLQLAQEIGITQSDSWLSWLPPFHDMGLVGGILTPLCAGRELTLMSPTTFLRRPADWLRAMSRLGATISGGPNFAFELCVRRVTESQCQGLDLSRWRYACCGSERVRPDTLDRFAEKFERLGFRRASFAPCYGLAEAVLAVTMRPRESSPRELQVDAASLHDGRVQCPRPGASQVRLVSSGRPIAGRGVTIVNREASAAVDSDRVGEIWVAASDVAHGYWDKPDLSNNTFRARLGAGDDVYLRTGDLGFVHDGELFVTGRCKDLIILGGVNHYPEDLEASAGSCLPALINTTAAFSIEQSDEERLVVVQETDATTATALQPIEAAVRDAVAKMHDVYVSDVVLVPLGSIPKTSSGKIQRALCRERYLDHSLRRLNARETRTESTVDPGESDIERRVTSIMADVLSVPEVGADDDFFRLGGHSLMGTQLVARLCEEFEVEIQLSKLFQTPTARALARAIEQAPRRNVPSPSRATRRSSSPSISLSQQRMWFLHELDRSGAAYNVAGAIRIHGPFEIEAFRRAFDQVLIRHEVLRSNYWLEAGSPTLRVRDFAPLAFAVIDYSCEPLPEACARRAASALASAPFDVARELLVRLQVYRLGPDCHIVAASMHHLVTDAWSMGVIMDDLLGCYDAIVHGRPLPEHNPSISFSDVARWQRERLDVDRLAIDLEFWLTELRGAKPVELPCDRPRSGARTSQGSHHQFDVPAEVLAAVRELALAQHATPFMVMLAAFAVVIYRHTGSSDLVIGVPVANRTHSSSEGVVGSLVNTLALRLRFEPDMTFSELLERVAQTTIESLEHQEMPFERLVSELGLERRPGMPPLIQVMFDYQNTPMPSGNRGQLQLLPVTISRGASQFDLSLMALDTELGNSFGFEYSTDIFDAPTIRRFAEHFSAVLETTALDPNRQIDRIDVLASDERQQILECAGPRATRREPNADFLTRIRDNMRVRADAPAVSDSSQSLTYAELGARVDALRSHLEALGVKPGDRVALVAERSAWLNVAMLAVLELGAVYVPLDPDFPAERIEYVLRDCAAHAIIAGSRSNPALSSVANTSRIVYLDAVRVRANAGRPAPRVRQSPSRPAYLLYTSGSTGQPKGVEVSFGALDNFLQSMLERPGISSDDVLLAVTTVAFDIAGLELLLPLAAGAAIYVAASEVAANAQALVQLMGRVRPTVMQATPATWSMLLDSGLSPLTDLKILCGGELLDARLATRLLSCSKSVWNMYGPTETTIWSMVHQVSLGEDPIPIGSPIDRTRVYVLDRRGELCPVGVSGEIHIGGAGVANGYWQREALTAERFVIDPFYESADGRMYRTGDLGALRHDGLFIYLGRIDNQIKLRGFRIEPGEVEAAIRAETGLNDVIVVTRELRASDTRLVAYYVKDAAIQIEPYALNERLRRKLPAYMVPSAFVGVDRFPQTPNGKLDRNALPAPDLADSAATRASLPPRDDLERSLAAIWCELLGVEIIGINDDFFSAGGHSLLAVQLFARIEQDLGISIPLASLFEAPTIAALAERIRGLERVPDSGIEAGALSNLTFEQQAVRGCRHVVAIRATGNQLPLFCIHGAGGHVMNFAALASEIGRVRPVYGLQAQGVDGRSLPVRHLRQAAEQYLGEIRAVQPKGPYLLVGYCLGGLVALEIARLLEASGERVGLVGLVNTYFPGLALPNHRIRHFAQNVWRGGLRFLSRWLPAFSKRTFVECIRFVGVVWARTLRRQVPIALRDYWVTRAFFHALRRYRLEPFAGRITVFRAIGDPIAASAGADLGWGQAPVGGLITLDVGGDHATVMERPNVTAVCRAIESSIAAETSETLK